MKIAMLSTFPPTQCGIATFTQSLASAMAQGNDVNIIRLNPDEYSKFNSSVIHEHASLDDLILTGHVMNSHDVAIIQHEFGIYGGRDGEDLLQILGALRIPAVTVLHTVINAPTLNQRRVMQGIINSSNLLVTMTEIARRNLIRNYDVKPERVRVIAHGSPDLRTALSLNAGHRNPRFLTWGLISEGKGIEWGIDALALLKDMDPMPEYVVAGRTHPKVLERDGEAYRNNLIRRAASLGVLGQLTFVDSYLTPEQLAALVSTSDAILLPYDSREQVTSGVLVEALVAGGPVIATRFPHAVEVLTGGAGLLVNHEDPEDIASALRMAITNPRVSESLKMGASEISHSYLWNSVGGAYSELVEELVKPKVLLQSVLASA
jgi:glycosyltransferase involved in cell wall biosynthesis